MIRARLSWLLAVAALGGCGSSDDAGDRLGDAPAYPIPGCEQFDASLCDTRDVACQTRLLAITACLRGEAPGELPPISVVSPSEYGDRLRAAYADAPPFEVGPFERTLVQLGLLTTEALSIDEQVRLAQEFVWGVYFYEGEEIVLSDQDRPFDGDLANGVLVHEFVHALQDRAVDLESYKEAYATSGDAGLAIQALIEGEADLIRYRYAAPAFGLDPASVDYERTFQNVVEYAHGNVVESVAPLASSVRLFAYAFGARYAHRVFAEAGVSGLNDVWASPPLTTQAFFSVPGSADSDFEPVEFDAPAPAPEGELVASSVLGAWGVFALLATSGANVGRAEEAARAWRGDGYFVYTRPADREAAVWRIELADEGAAGRFASGLPNGFEFVRTGTTVTIAVGDNTALPANWDAEP
jgi:hypothetical protein